MWISQITCGEAIDERDDERKPRPGRRQSAPRLPVEQHKQQIGRGQYDDEIFGPERAAEGDAEQ